MSEVNQIQNWRQILRDQLEGFVQQMPPWLGATHASLAARINFKGDRSEGWVDQFSDLVLLYPSLQFCHLADDLEKIREAQFVHLLLLIHSVVEDRLIDGQLPFKSEEYLYSKHLFTEAIGRLLSLTTAERIHCSWANLHKRYVYGQGPACNRLLAEEPSSPVSILIQAACARATLGYITSEFLAHVLGIPPMHRQSMQEAYDLVVVALQWADDAEDLDDDMITGSANLILALAAHEKEQGETSGAESPGSLELSYLRIEALERARRNLEEAIKVQRSLGADSLCDMHHGLTDRFEKTATTKRIALRDTFQFALASSMAQFGHSKFEAHWVASE